VAIVNAGSTVTTDDAADVTVSGVDALSETSNSKRYVPVGVESVVANEHVTVNPSAAPVPLGAAHCSAVALL